MREHSKKLRRSRDKSAVPYAASILFIGALVLGSLAFLLMNTLGLHQRLQENTNTYANDISGQLASNISARMNLREIYVRNLADTFSGMPEFLLTEELLERKAEYLGMDEFFIVNADGTVFPEGVDHPELGAYLAEHPDMHEDSHIFYTDHDEVFFSSPIC